MGKSSKAMVVLMAVLMLVQTPTPVTAAVDNVAFQWTDLLNTLLCTQFAAPLTAGIQQQLHLSQWHSLLALRGIGGGTKEEAVVAYASWKILGHYYSFGQVSRHIHSLKCHKCSTKDCDVQMPKIITKATYRQGDYLGFPNVAIPRENQWNRGNLCH